MSDLKPCPFCGGEAQIGVRMDEDIWSHNTVPYTRVACRECEIGTDYLCEGWEPTAPDAWNLRAAPDLLQMLHECAEYIAALNGEQDDYCQRARALIARATGAAS